jgi:hypothetical protein
MAERSLEQMMQDEYRRLTEGWPSAEEPAVMTMEALLPPPAEQKTSSAAAVADPAKAQTLSTAGEELLSRPVVSASDKTSGNELTDSPLLLAAKLPASSGTVNRGYTLQVTEKTDAQPAEGDSLPAEIGTTALKVLSSGFGLLPAVSSLVGFFGGDGPETPEPLTKYAMPRAIQIRAANTQDGQTAFADYGQDGMARSFTTNGSAGAPAMAGPEPQTSAMASQAPQVVVNVQAMDSRSFLDHSQEIAQAVREAMLNMHPLNDFVSEL